MMHGHNFKQITSVVCPECHDGYMTHRGNSPVLTCSKCQYMLSCPYCGGCRSLVLQTKSEPKFIECTSCKTKFWEAGFEGKTRWGSESRLPKIAGQTKRRTAQSCEYCGGSDADCPYCGNPRTEHCPKCTSKFVKPYFPDGVRSASNLYRCETCETRFESGAKTQKRLIELPPAKPGLVTDRNVVQKLAATLLRQCPVCKSEKIVPDNNGIKCRVCNSSWFPGVPTKEDFGSLPGETLADQFWKEVCPKCHEMGAIARLACGKLQCFACDHQWRKVVSPIVIKGNKTEEVKQDNSLFKRFDTLCDVCKGGFVVDGRCQRCGCRARVCGGCSRPYTDKTQTGGLCQECKGTAASYRFRFTCPTCKHTEGASRADIYVRCGRCENEYAVQIPVAGEPPSNADDDDDRDFDYDNTEESAFQRWNEKKSDIAGIVDDALSLLQEISDTILEGKEPMSEVSELEQTMERLGELQRYIDDGVDVETASQDEDLWHEDDEQMDARWKQFDLQHKIRSADYNEVTIIDAGSELLGEEEFCFHEKNIAEVKCPQCGGPFNQNGYCAECYSLLNELGE